MIRKLFTKKYILPFTGFFYLTARYTHASLALCCLLFLPSVALSNGLPISANKCQNGVVESGGCTIDTASQASYGFDYSLTGNIVTGLNVGINFNTVNNNTLNLRGSINTTGSSGAGVYLNTSNYNTSNIIGNISTTGLGGNGIYLLNSSSNNTFMIGDISTTGDNALGIHLVGNFQGSIKSNITTLTGNITTTGDSAHAFSTILGDANTNIITGNITTSGDYAYGILMRWVNDIKTSISGDIITKGLNADAINFSVFNSNSNTSISGNITTTGDNSDGIELGASSTTITVVTGGIFTAGANSHALRLTNSDSNIFNMTGGISATGAGSYAINLDGTSDNNAITFNQGSHIIGGLYNDGANNTLRFNLGRAASYNFATEGAVDWILEDTSKTVVAGSAKSRGVADFDDAGNRLYQRFSQLNNSLNQQHRQVAQGQPRGAMWLDSYYSDLDRHTVGSQLSQITRGVTVGFNASGHSEMPIDVLVNVENTDSGYGLSEQTIDSNSMLLGLAFPQLLTAGDGSLAVKLLAGKSDNNRKLTVLNNTLSTGQEVVSDKYKSDYVNVGAQWLQTVYRTKQLHHDLILGADIAHERIEGSTASSYYQVQDRNITQLLSQAEYGVTFTGDNNKLRVNGSIGVTHATMISGEQQHYTIDGIAASYNADESNTYYTASLGAHYQVTPQAKAYLTVQKSNSSDDIDGVSGNLGLAVRF